MKQGALPRLSPFVLYLTLLLQFMILRRAMSMASSSSNTKKGALIFLHGLGDTPAGWSSLEDQLPQLNPLLKDIVYVFPPAPIIPISINGGATMPGWFDLYDWPIGVGSKDDKEGLLKGVAQIEQEVQKLQDDQGFTKKQIVVGGFSQGGAVALLSAYRSQTTDTTGYAGCAALSGWLTLPTELKPSDVVKGTPLFWGHGQLDDKVLFEQQEFGVNKLKEAGVQSIQDESYRMGHASDPDEINSLADFLVSSLGLDEKKTKDEL